MGNAKPSDDLGQEVKSQSCLGIAGSPRNSFRASGWNSLGGGRALDEKVGIFSAFSTKLRIPPRRPTNQTLGTKLQRSRGKQPRPPAKVPKFLLSALKDVLPLKQVECWLRSSHHLKSA